MKWPFIYVVSLFGLWHTIDLEADTLFSSKIAPFLFSFVFIAFLFWLILKMSRRSSSSTSDGGGGVITTGDGVVTTGSFFDVSGGGDCSGGDCGGGGGD
ncbi:hypothetical protein [Nitrincola sp.]|uniref:hypothetical protein n=1 Tax=Nitrincola sp. TaxID=1926584 RepID=UPI003A903DA9